MFPNLESLSASFELTCSRSFSIKACIHRLLSFLRRNSNDPIVIVIEAIYVHRLYACVIQNMMQSISTSHLLWHINRTSSSNGITDVKGMVIARIGRVISSMDEECVGVPSSDIDDWDEGGVEVPGYAPARAAYSEKRCRALITD